MSNILTFALGHSLFALLRFGLATGTGMPEIEHEYANCNSSLDFLWHHYYFHFDPVALFLLPPETMRCRFV